MNILFNLKQKFEKFDENWRSDLEKTFSSSNKKSAEKHAFWIDHEFLRIFYHNNFPRYTYIGFVVMHIY